MNLKKNCVLGKGVIMNTTPDPDRLTMRGCVSQCEWCPGPIQAGRACIGCVLLDSPPTASGHNRGIGTAHVKRALSKGQHLAPVLIIRMATSPHCHSLALSTSWESVGLNFLLACLAPCASYFRSIFFFFSFCHIESHHQRYKNMPNLNNT